MKDLIFKHCFPDNIEVLIELAPNRFILVADDGRKDLKDPDHMVAVLFFNAFLQKSGHDLEEGLPYSDILDLDQILQEPASTHF